MSEPVARLMASLLEDLAELFAFVNSSRWARRQGQPGISDFVFGNPHDPPVAGLVDALSRWAAPQRADWFAYKMNEEPARTAVAASLAADLGIPVEPEDVFLTPGTFGGLSASLRTIIDPGDEVIFISPPWFFYAPMIRIAGGAPVRVKAALPSCELDLGRIADAISPHTRAIIVNTPNNPSGAIYTPAALERLGGLLEEASARIGRRIYLLSDEAYRRILFDGSVHVSPARFYPATFILYTYGKTLLAPGERLGYIAFPPQMPDREALRDAVFMSQTSGGWQFPNATLQFALPELEQVSIDVRRLQARRDRLVEALRKIGYAVFPPQATFYILVRSPLRDDGAFVEMLAEHDVFVLPGRSFELPGYFRLSVTASDEMIERSLPGFEKAFAAARETPG